MAVRRYSKQRELIYNCLKSTKSHPTAETIYQWLKPEHPNLSLGTVYRNLNLLSEDGTVLRIPLDVDHFDADTSNHGHLACRNCNCVVDLEGDAAAVLNAYQAHNPGTKLDGYNLVFWGLCTACAG